jgi:hypothetical protein
MLFYLLVMKSPVEIVEFPLTSIARISNSYSAFGKRNSGGTLRLVTDGGRLIKALLVVPSTQGAARGGST